MACQQATATKGILRVATRDVVTMGMITMGVVTKGMVTRGMLIVCTAQASAAPLLVVAGYPVTILIWTMFRTGCAVIIIIIYN